MRTVALLLLWLCPLALADVHIVYTKDKDKAPDEIPAKLWIKGDKMLIESWSGERKLVRLDLGYVIALDAKGAIRSAKKLREPRKVEGELRFEVVKGEAAKIAGLDTQHYKIARKGKVVFELWAYKGAGTTWSRYIRADLPPTKGIEATDGVWLQIRGEHRGGQITITASKVDTTELDDKLFAIPTPDGQSEEIVVARWAGIHANKNRLRQLMLALITYRDGQGRAVHFPPLKSLLSSLYTSEELTELELFACARGGKVPTKADLEANRLDNIGFVSTTIPYRTNKGASEFPWAWDRGMGGIRVVGFADGHVEEMPEARFQQILAAAKKRDAALEAQGLAPMHKPDKD